MMTPYLVDPNTGVMMFESADIISYLRELRSARTQNGGRKNSDRREGKGPVSDVSQTSGREAT
jgi:hypothetical protein